MGMWGEYVPVDVRQKQAQKQMEKLRKKGKKIEPIVIEGRTIARQFWGKKWCDHIENFADYDNRLPRGRTYVRNGSVCHLNITEGAVEAMVSGSSIYTVNIEIKKIAISKWKVLKEKCRGLIGSILELLQGKISKNVMEIVSNSIEGLFPEVKEISYSCSCPDWAGMCKHVAATLYGIGSRLDDQPELLFRLRGVDPQELVSIPTVLEIESTENVLANAGLEELFDIEFESLTPVVEKKTKAASVTAPKIKKTKKEKKSSKLDLNALTGSSLQKFRMHKNMTVAEFADAVGVTPASIYRWEGEKGLLNLRSKAKQGLEKL